MFYLIHAAHKQQTNTEHPCQSDEILKRTEELCIQSKEQGHFIGFHFMYQSNRMNNASKT